MGIYYLYEKLGTNSKHYFDRLAKDPANIAKARFRGNLLERLAKETGLTVNQVFIELLKELEEQAMKNNS